MHALNYYYLFKKKKKKRCQRKGSIIAQQGDSRGGEFLFGPVQVPFASSLPCDAPQLFGAPLLPVFPDSTLPASPFRLRPNCCMEKGKL